MPTQKISEETYLSSEGVKLWVVAQGSGVPVVLCNGGPGCCDYLGPVANIFGDGFQVIRFEARGCGRSGKASDYSVASSVADLEAVRQHFGIDRWIVAGHSWGADLALFYALEHSEYCIGLICMAGGRIHNDREWHRVYKENREAGLEPALEFDYPPNMEVNAQVNASWKRCIQQPQLLKQIANLNVPTQFIYGSEDIRPHWPVQQVAELLPDARFELIEGADHHLWLSKPTQLKAHIKSFVGSLEAT